MHSRFTLTVSVPVLALGAALLWWSGSAAPAGASAAGNGGLFNGSMGAKVFPSGETIVDLASEGLYNPSVYGWAVVFDWTMIDVPSDATVRFTNHPSGAPVIWHATGDVTIDGRVHLDGEAGRSYTSPPAYAAPGPGGYRGGRGSYFETVGSSAGLGPGGGYKDAQISYAWNGGQNLGGAGSHGGSGVHHGGNAGFPGPTYGGASVFPLLGGSGGAGGDDASFNRAGGGGGGGGAILIAADGLLSLSSTAVISCLGGAAGQGDYVNGGYGTGQNHGGGGSGGAIRLVGDSVSIQGAQIRAIGQSGGGYGRIRIEANASTAPENYHVDAFVSPTPSESMVAHELVSPMPPSLQVIAFNPDPDGNPGVWTDISFLTDPNDVSGGPRAALNPPGLADVQLPGSGIVALQILADHVDAGETVEVRVSPARGQAFYLTSTPLVPLTGTQTTAEVEVDFSEGVSAIQLRVDLDD